MLDDIYLSGPFTTVCVVGLDQEEEEWGKSIERKVFFSISYVEIDNYI